MTPPDEETPEETPETEGEEAPKRRRRRRRGAAASEDAPAAESPRAEAEDEADVVDETPEDVEAEEAAADVMLEADAEAEGEDAEEAEAETEAEEEELEELEPLDEEEGEPESEPEEAPAPAPAPARRRRGQRGERRDVVVRAQAKYVRSSARKARLVCDHIRGKSVDEARAILAHTSRAVARDWSKLLESAVANAENNHELVGEDLYVKEVHADEGPTIRRFRPRAMGRATRIRKRTSHLTILLTPKD
jgi:ribosomal protein L22